MVSIEEGDGVRGRLNIGWGLAVAMLALVRLLRRPRWRVRRAVSRMRARTRDCSIPHMPVTPAKPVKPRPHPW